MDKETLAKVEKAEEVYRSEPLFRKFADRAHRKHCDASDAAACIEEDHFLVRILNDWDESYFET